MMTHTYSIEKYEPMYCIWNTLWEGDMFIIAIYFMARFSNDGNVIRLVCRK